MGPAERGGRAGSAARYFDGSAKIWRGSGKYKEIILIA